VTIVGWIMIAVGFIAYLAAFGLGAGPTMGDKPMQASLFTLATILMIGGFLVLVL
jgi:hypothetical protein